MNLDTVYSTLKAELNLSVPIIEPNQIVDLENNSSYVRLTIMEKVPMPLALNTDVMVRSGFLQIDVFSLVNTGTAEIAGIVDLITTVFKRNRMFNSILIKYCTTEPGRVDNKKYWSVPILVSWETQY